MAIPQFTLFQRGKSCAKPWELGKPMAIQEDPSRDRSNMG